MIPKLKSFIVQINQTEEYYAENEEDCRKLVNKDFNLIEDVNIDIEEME